jgi:hypothetical protein
MDGELTLLMPLMAAISFSKGRVMSASISLAEFPK